MLFIFLLPLAVIACGQAGLFSGKAPTDLGLHDGMLKAPDAGATNVVSSYAKKQAQGNTNNTGIDKGDVIDTDIEPLRFNGDSNAAFGKLTQVVAAMSGATIIKSEPAYLYAQFSTPMLKFIDDVEFVLDAPAGTIHMRSASRLGKKDFGTNRKRLEAIRLRFAA